MRKNRNVRIVATLALINMIVRMNRLLRAEFSPKDFNGTVRNNLSTIISSSGEFDNVFGLTSLAFMLLCVPLPVWKTTRGKWSSNFPDIT